MAVGDLPEHVNQLPQGARNISLHKEEDEDAFDEKHQQQRPNCRHHHLANLAFQRFARKDEFDLSNPPSFVHYGDLSRLRDGVVRRLVREINNLQPFALPAEMQHDLRLFKDFDGKQRGIGQMGHDDAVELFVIRVIEQALDGKN